MDASVIRIIAPVVGLCGLIAAFFTYRSVAKHGFGAVPSPVVSATRAEVIRVAILVLVIGVLLAWKFGVYNLFAFVVGALASGMIGFVLMKLLRRQSGLGEVPLNEDLPAGEYLKTMNLASVFGVTTAGLGLVTLGFLFGQDQQDSSVMLSYVFGVMSVTLLLRSHNRLFDNYVGALVAAVLVASNLGVREFVSLYQSLPMQAEDARRLMMALPVLIAVFGLVASLVGILAVHAFKKLQLKRAILATQVVALIVFTFSTLIAVSTLEYPFSVLWPALVGAVAAIIFADRRVSGLPALMLLTATIWAGHHFAGWYGIAIAAVGMVALTGLIGTIRFLGEFKPAVTSHFATSSAVICALGFFMAYKQSIKAHGVLRGMDLADVHIVFGLFIGVVLLLIFETLNSKSKGKFLVFNAELQLLLTIGVPIIIGIFAGPITLGGVLVGVILGAAVSAFRGGADVQMNIVIQTMSIVAVLIVPLIA